MGETQRFEVTLDADRAAKLSRLAARVGVADVDLAGTLLSSALDDAEPQVSHVVNVLDGLAEAYARAQLGRRQAAEGKTIRLEDL